MPKIENPYRPGSGVPPPHLAGRETAMQEFRVLLEQDQILTNGIVTGLRGIGKSVLLEYLRPIATTERWLWVGSDISPTVCLTEENMAIRLLTDLAAVTSGLTVTLQENDPPGFARKAEIVDEKLDYRFLLTCFQQTPGLNTDKVKACLRLAWESVKAAGFRGIVFAYDEAQTLRDDKAKAQFPLSLLLDTFQSIQRQGVPFMLLLAGLPTLFPRLVDARTFTERMFRTILLDRLSPDESRAAITKPMEKSTWKLSPVTVEQVVERSGGYPYFIQFMCKVIFDLIAQQPEGSKSFSTPWTPILERLDMDFFSARWAKVTDRQRELLWVVATMDPMPAEFTAQDIVERSKVLLNKGFGASHTTQMLAALCEAGIVYKNRHGKYAWALPLMAQFVKRQPPPEGHVAAPLFDLGTTKIPMPTFPPPEPIPKIKAPGA